MYMHIEYCTTIDNIVTYSLHIALLVIFLLQYSWEQSGGHPMKKHTVI